MKKQFIYISFIALIAFVISPATIAFGQDSKALSKEDKVLTLFNLLYSVEGYEERLGHALTNNSTFIQNVENDAFVEELSILAEETSINEYLYSIKNGLLNEFNESQIDSLIQLLDSPTGHLLIKLFEMDNSVVEYDLATHTNKMIDRAYKKSVMASNLSHEEVVKNFQEELNESYLQAASSPLPETKRKIFEEIGGHAFYEINSKYKVEASLEVFPEPEQIKMNTSNSQVQDYNVYAKATFVLDGQEIELFIYQSQRLMVKEVYKNHLFLPFTDLSSGEETYGGGRYIDLKVPQDQSRSITIDFNQAYQPYCAYTSGYSCPIPPAENFIDAKIEAGVKNIDLE